MFCKVNSHSLTQLSSSVNNCCSTYRTQRKDVRNNVICQCNISVQRLRDSHVNPTTTKSLVVRGQRLSIFLATEENIYLLLHTVDLLSYQNPWRFHVLGFLAVTCIFEALYSNTASSLLLLSFSHMTSSLSVNTRIMSLDQGCQLACHSIPALVLRFSLALMVLI